MSRSLKRILTPLGWLRWGRCLAATIVWLLIAQASGHGAEVEAGTQPFRFGFSSSMLLNVSHNDAKAAVKVWARIIAQERGVPTDPDPSILNGIKPIVANMRASTLDAVALTLVEYRELSRQLALSDLFVAVQGGGTNVEYLLLVHRDSAITNLAGLQGRNLVCLENPRTSLALPWFDTLLAQEGHKPAASFLGRVTQNRKLSTAVLPVFFRQADACLVDRMGFETMCELNPQVATQLRPLAVSPVFVPMLFCMRADYTPVIKDRIIDALASLHSSPAGQQVLTVLQFEKIQRANASSLESGLSLLAEHDRLCGETEAEETSSRPSDPQSGSATGGGE